MEDYDYFMVYRLLDSGEREKLDVDDPSQLGSILDPEKVFVIVREELRRIYIWKGAKSPVRKRFISSRVTGALQEELVKEAAFHRCKIVSIDQGDELEEFLNAFGLESMEVEEKLADLRYIRNVDRQKMLDRGEIPDETPKIVKIKKTKEEEEYISPLLEELEPGEEKVVSLPSKSKPKPKAKSKPIRNQAYSTPVPRTSGPSKKAVGLSKDKKEEIMKKILDTDTPTGYKRQNLILGHTLYGAVLKKVAVFGEEIEEVEWEPVENLPKEIIEIDDRKLRVYFDKNKGMVEAVEVLVKGDGKAEKKTKSAGKSSEKKTENQKPKSSKRRELPKIPSEKN